MFCMQFKDNMGCCNTSNGEFKEMNNFLIAVLVGATLAILLNLSGLSMVFYGIVVRLLNRQILGSLLVRDSHCAHVYLADPRQLGLNRKLQ